MEKITANPAPAVAMFLALGLSLVPLACDINLSGGDDRGDDGGDNGGTDGSDPSADSADSADGMDAGDDGGMNDGGTAGPPGDTGVDGTVGDDATDDADDSMADAGTGVPDAGGGASCQDDDSCFGNCCEWESGHPGCDDPGVTEAVCAADPVCCETGWDLLCIAQMQQLFGEDACFAGVNLTDPGCCTDGSTCGVPEVTECVCAADPFCCEVEWNEFCVQAVEDCEFCVDTPEASVCLPMTCEA